MLTIKQIYNDIINEKLITFGNKPYPNAGHAVILAGGAGSGKGFVLSNLIGLEGKIFNVDVLKGLSVRLPIIKKHLKDKFGIDEYDPLNSEHVSILHMFLKDELKLMKKIEFSFFNSTINSDPSLKPNVIFDVTLKELQKLVDITEMVKKLGYIDTNIHIVWILNELELALKQNKTRDRAIADDILINTHVGVAMTMSQILSMGDNIKQFMDGDIILAFNKIKVDSDFVKSDRGGGGYIKSSNYIRIKNAGEKQLYPAEINKELLNKIIKYMPKEAQAFWKEYL